MIGYAHTLVRTEPKYAGVVKFLVGNVLVVDDAADRHCIWFASAGSATRS